MRVDVAKLNCESVNLRRLLKICNLRKLSSQMNRIPNYAKVPLEKGMYVVVEPHVHRKLCCCSSVACAVPVLVCLFFFLLWTVLLLPY